MKNIYKVAALGSLISLANCQSGKISEDKPIIVTNTYTLQTCDKEAKALFIEMQQNDQNFTGFINTDNQHKIPETQKKFKIGKQISGNSVKSYFDGIYLTRE